MLAIGSMSDPYIPLENNIQNVKQNKKCINYPKTYYDNWN